jgi:TonB-dependent starch-binding outer membrane protein SusC
MVSRVRWRSLLLAVAASMFALAGDAAAQATGVVEGKVSEQGTGRPLAGAQVFIAGTTVGALTNDQGTFRITGVPARQVEVRFRLIGYAPINRRVVVEAGQTARVDVEVSVSALQLEQVVVTGTGQAVEVKKLGNTVATIEPPSFAPITTAADLLTAREAGVNILPASGIAGEGARIRIRGNASLAMSNEPIVFVDGIRVNSGGGFGDNTGAGGGGVPSRLDDIDPASIERVEVLKGAAAATLYGTEASNGVIQIFTKRGTSGSAKWQFNAEQATSDFDINRIKDNCGSAKSDTAAARLSTFFGRQITAFVPFCINATDDIVGRGQATTLNASVTGGTSGYTYYVSGRFSDENGPMDVDWLGLSQDRVRRIHGMTNLGVVPFNNMKIGIRMSYADALMQVPQNNNNIYGTTSLAMFAKPELANCDRSAVASAGRCTGAGNMYGNATFMTVRESAQQQTENKAGRFTGILDLTYTPTGDITASATLGMDATDDRSFRFRYFRYDVDRFTGNQITGNRLIDANSDRQYTVDSKLSWRSQLVGLQSDFVAGIQGFLVRSTFSGGQGDQLPGPGLEIASAALVQTISERFVQTVNGGFFAQDQLGYKDFTYLTVGGRYDYSSAFGENAGGVFYPKISISIVPSDLRTWTAPLGLSTFRVRAALGKSGRQPNAFDKFTTYAPLSSELGAGLAPANLGNPDLKPEVSTEWEAGAEFGILQNRFGFDFTYWNRTVNDALVARQFPVSGGFRATQLANVGELAASGYDMNLKGFLVQRATWSLDAFANAAYIKQEIVSLGGAPPLKVGGSYVRYRNFLKEGYGPGTLFGAALPGPCSARPEGKNYTCLNDGQLPFDFNNNGIPDTEQEVLTYLSQPRPMNQVEPMRYDEDGDGDYLDHFLGKPYPDWSGSFGANLNFMRNWRFNTLFEYRGGNFTVTNLTDAFRNSHGVIGTNTLIAAQTEATIRNPASTPQQRLEAAKQWLKLRALSPYDGLNQNEDGSFVRLREIGISYNAPARLAAKLGAKDMALSLAGRNLFLWTNYSGTDPETNANGRRTDGGVDGNYLEAVDAFGWPLARRIALSIRLGY